RILGTIRAGRDWRDDRDAEERVKRLESNPPIEQNGNSIRIGHIEERDWQRNISISYEVSVPAETRVRSHTGSGSPTSESVRGPVESGNGSGSITLSNIGDEVRASTSSGSIRLDGIKGRLRASTGSGTIRGTGIGGAIVATTGSGSIRFEQSAAGGAE